MKILRRFLLPCLLCLPWLMPAADAQRPNILFVIFDDWNGSTHAGAYGCSWIKTPNFDRVDRKSVV